MQSLSHNYLVVDVFSIKCISLHVTVPNTVCSNLNSHLYTHTRSLTHKHTYKQLNIFQVKPHTRETRERGKSKTIPMNMCVNDKEADTQKMNYACFVSSCLLFC